MPTTTETVIIVGSTAAVVTVLGLSYLDRVERRADRAFDAGLYYMGLETRDEMQSRQKYEEQSHDPSSPGGVAGHFKRLFDARGIFSGTIDWLEIRRLYQSYLSTQSNKEFAAEVIRAYRVMARADLMSMMQFEWQYRTDVVNTNVSTLWVFLGVSPEV